MTFGSGRRKVEDEEVQESQAGLRNVRLGVVIC